MFPKELAKKIKLFEIRTRKLMQAGLSGEYRSVFRGRGIEFDEVRLYAPGDDARLIDWNVTARTGTLHIKKHTEEREQTVIFAVDLSRSQDFGSIAKTKRDIAAEICCILSFAAALNNDRVGLLLFTDKIEKYVPPARGARHALRIVRDLLYHRPSSAGTSIARALDYLNRVVRRSAVLFLVSDFISPNFDKQLAISSRKHDVIAISLADPMEEVIQPAGLVTFVDAETGERVIVDSSHRLSRRLGQDRLRRERQERLSLFRRLSIDHLEVRTEAPYDAQLRRLFAARAQRL